MQWIDLYMNYLGLGPDKQSLSQKLTCWTEDCFESISVCLTNALLTDATAYKLVQQILHVYGFKCVCTPYPLLVVAWGLAAPSCSQCQPEV